MKKKHFCLGLIGNRYFVERLYARSAQITWPHNKGKGSKFEILISMQPDVVDLDISNYSNSVWSKSLSLKYQKFTPSGCEDIGIRTFKFVGKFQLL